MKKTLFFAFFLCVSMQMNAQIFEIKARPIAFLLRSYPFSVEYQMKAKPNIGLDFELTPTNSDLNILQNAVSSKGISAVFAGKYYGNPKKGFDGFYYGPYIKYADLKQRTVSQSVTLLDYRDEIFTLGFWIGNKWVLKDNILLELAVGSGYAGYRKTTNFIDPTKEVKVIRVDFLFRIAIGYRFNDKENEE
jgi:hypothetical protein